MFGMTTFFQIIHRSHSLPFGNFLYDTPFFFIHSPPVLTGKKIQFYISIRSKRFSTGMFFHCYRYRCGINIIYNVCVYRLCRLYIVYMFCCLIGLVGFKTIKLRIPKVGLHNFKSSKTVIRMHQILVNRNSFIGTIGSSVLSIYKYTNLPLLIGTLV